MELNPILQKLEKKRPQVARLGLSSSFLIIMSLLLDGLSDIIWPVILLFAVVLIPMSLLSTFVSRLMARSIVVPLRNMDKLNDAEFTSVLRNVESFPLKESVWIFFLWTLGAAIVELMAWLWLGITPWQVVLMSTLAFFGALIESLLSYHADQRTLGVLRIEILSRLSSRAHVGSSFVLRLLYAYMVLVFMVLCASMLVWIDRDSSERAKDVISGDMVEFLSAARHVSNYLKAGQEPSNAIENSSAAKSGWTSMLVKDSGEIVTGNRDVDKSWLLRIIEVDSSTWQQKRAPFLYMRKNVTKSMELFWIQENRFASEIFWQVGIWVLLAALLMAGVGMFLLRSIIVTSIRPIRRLTKTVEAISQGAIYEDMEVELGGEIGELSKGMQQLVVYVRSVLEAGRSFSESLLLQRGRLSDRIDALRKSSEKREELAEQTAAAILQMRMSVDSIAEQVDSLKISSTDCTSSLFEIEQSVREVSSSAENLQSLVDDAAEDIAQITNSMKMVKNSMDTLAGRADDTNATVSAMGAANSQVESNISDTNRLIEQVSEIATQGAQSVEETISGINEIQLVTHEARDVINSLSQQMNAVGKILTVISDVAQQTNLLALNAAIIAAAAGEHGKGFAVVADEIKDLADRTASSTKEISGLIKSVQADSKRAVAAMERGSSSVNNGVQLANKAGAALQQILISVSEVLRMAGEIRESTKAHGQLATSISHSMAKMAEMLRDVRQSMADQTASGERINRVAEQLRDDAKFVGRSASEQVQAVTGVSRSMEKMSEMVGFIAKAITEQAQGIGHVAKAAEEVRDSSSLELQRLTEVEEVLDLLGRTVVDLKNKIRIHDGQENEA